jgi:hypothetical protein
VALRLAEMHGEFSLSERGLYVPVETCTDVLQSR